MKTIARHLRAVHRPTIGLAACAAADPIRVRLGRGCFEVVDGGGVLLTSREPEWAAFDGLLFAELRGRPLELDQGVPPRALELARELLSDFRRADSQAED